MPGGMAKRLERIEGDYREEALERIREARRNVGKIVSAAARERGLKLTGRNRDKLYALIDGEYAKLEIGLRSWSKELVGDGVKAGFEEAMAALKDVDGAKLTRFDRKLAEQVFDIISPGNESQLAGVLTKKMKDTDLANLRRAQRDTERQAILEGWDSGRKARELKMRWGELAGGMENAKFVDAAGKTWDTDAYVKMLVNTTAERTRREGYMEGLAENGDDLVKVEVVDGDACEVCADWDGRILSISGTDKRFPSYQDAVDDGMFHPNCRCRLERVDEEWDADEIEEQAEENAEREEAEELEKETPESTREGRTRRGGEAEGQREEGTNGGAPKRRSDEGTKAPTREAGTAGAKGRTAAPRQDTNGTVATREAENRVGGEGGAQSVSPGTTKRPEPSGDGGRWAWSRKREEREAIEQAVYTDEERLFGSEKGMNGSYVLKNGKTVLFKPQKEEKPAENVRRGSGIPNGTQWKREVAASIVDELLGTDLVPTTVELDYDGRKGSAQLFVDRTVPIEVVKWTYGQAYDKVKSSGMLERLDLLDGVIGNLDRHGKNALIDSSMHVWAIDNGLSFPCRDVELRIWGNWSGDWNLKDGKTIPPKLLDLLKNFQENFGEVESRLADIVEPEAIDQMRLRVERMMGTGKFIPGRYLL